MKYIYLLYSGGKDSTACLEQLSLAGILRWVKLLFIKTNACLPEQVDYVHQQAKRCADLVEVEVDVHKWIKEHGLPSDVVPVDSTTVGKFCGASDRQLISDRFACCSNNLWQALDDTISKLDDVEYLVIGDKDCDPNKRVFPTIPTAVGPVPVIRPVFFWTDTQVRQFLQDHGAWESRFDLHHSSLDCWCCTAYWSTYGERLQYLKQVGELKKAEELRRRMAVVTSEVKRQIEIVKE